MFPSYRLKLGKQAWENDYHGGPLPIPRWEAFCQKRFSGKAIIACGESNRTAHNILKHPCVQMRLAELTQMALSAKIMSVIERKERLSEIGRSSQPDITCVKAIAELNHMEDIGKGDTINNFNLVQINERREQLNAILSNPEARELARQLQRLMETRTGIGSGQVVEGELAQGTASRPAQLEANRDAPAPVAASSECATPTRQE